ncbi:MAG: flavin monoamine oxidase family protein [Polymorphobacter sp.]|uniref:flavin monoamine oxidase family protein n=1 Tax=Polymorphobacter sp. TaxID=1909290 RepID=UPI003A8812AA
MIDDRKSASNYAATGVNRRTATALLGGAALLPQAARGQGTAMERADVVIIGGGLAALQAGLTLLEAGASVIVLEATQRVGGRVYTARTAPLRPEYGASQIGRSYARVIDLCRRFGIALVPEDRTVLPMSNLINGQWVRSEDWEASNANKMVGEERALLPVSVGHKLMEKHNRLTSLQDWLDPAFADLDVSLRTLLTRHGHSPEALRLADFSTAGDDVDSASMLALMQEQARQRFDLSFGENEAEPAVMGFQKNVKPKGELATINNIEGGTSRLTDAMAAALGDRLRTREMVQRIDMDEGGAEVRCAGGNSYRARHVIAAVPFTALRKIVITPDLPPLQREAVNRLRYGHTTRGFGVINKPFWEEDGLEPSFFTDGAIRMFWALKPKAGEDFHRFMLVFTGASAARIDQLPEAEAAAFVAAELARIRPSMAGKTRLDAWYGWGRDPMIGGCRHVFAPGQVMRFAADMITPHRVLHFAGEHTRRIDFGMESALESGERAAFEIIERMS